MPAVSGILLDNEKGRVDECDNGDSNGGKLVSCKVGESLETGVVGFIAPVLGLDTE